MEHQIFFTVAEAKDILRVSRSNLYSLIAKGVITPSKLGGKTLIARSEIDRVVEAITPKRA